MKHRKSTEKEKEHQNEAEKTVNVAGEQPAPADNTTESASQAAQKEEEDPKVKIAELNDKLLRLYSEFDNYRKRTLKEKVEMSKTASEELIKDLLPVMDDFERAIGSFEKATEVEAIKEGIVLIFNKFKNTLNMRGLQEIPAIGEPFNTDYQEAIAHIPAPSEDLKNKVVDQVLKGYLLNDKVIRHSKVVVGS